MLHGVLCLKLRIYSVCVRRVVKVARWYGDVLVVPNPEPLRESRSSLSVCCLADILVEVSAEWESWAGIFIAAGNWGGSAGSDSRSPSTRLPKYPRIPPAMPPRGACCARPITK